MKKVLLLLFTIVLFSCSGDDGNPVSDDGGNNNSFDINPPLWTHGTWLITSGGFSSGLTLTDDDICNVTNTSSTCHKHNLIAYNQAGGYVNVDEEISETEYKADITIQSNTITYHVRKLSNNQIEWNASGTTWITLDKQ